MITADSEEAERVTSQVNIFLNNVHVFHEIILLYVFSSFFSVIFLRLSQFFGVVALNC